LSLSSYHSGGSRLVAVDELKGIGRVAGQTARPKDKTNRESPSNPGQGW
jgi:hypothetical protein